jgi:hypothetical protein
MNVGAIEEQATFNNAYVLREKRDELTAGARAYVAQWKGPGALIVSTHGANILPLLGIHPSEGEVVVVMPDEKSDQKMRLVGRIKPNS